MKKNYEDPFFEITRVSFEEIIMTSANPETPEESIGGGKDDGGEMPPEDD